jgi:hypothetical protein
VKITALKVISLPLPINHTDTMPCYLKYKGDIFTVIPIVSSPTATAFSTSCFHKETLSKAEGFLKLFSSRPKSGTPSSRKPHSRGYMLS